MHISALYCASTDTLSASHSQESLRCVCERPRARVRLCETEAAEGVYARTGGAGLGESLLTFSEPIGRLVRFSR